MLIVFNLLVIGAVLGFGYTWMLRGFFSAFLHLLCTLAAGAIAFAFWEPLSHVLLGVLPTGGFLKATHGMTWGIGLVLPFVVSLILLRVVVDKALPANVVQNSAVDYGGGFLCGAAASAIGVGIFVIAVSHFRLGTNFLGYQPVWYSENRNGSLVRNDKLWLPVDSLVASVYGSMSENALSTSEPLTRWRPDMNLTGFAARMSPGQGAGRNTFNHDDFNLFSSYTVGEEETPVNELLTDTFTEAAHSYENLSGSSVARGQLHGYVIEFRAGAKEDSKGAQVLVSNGQIHLVAEKTDPAIEGPRSQVIFPVAAISQADASDGDAYGRWRYDGEDVFIASVGGASTVKMGFEFVVPEGYTPLAISVKSARMSLGSEAAAKDPKAFAAPANRDGAIRSGALIKGSAEITLDEADSIVVPGEEVRNSFNRSLNPPGVYVSSRLGYVFDRQTANRGLDVEEDGRDNAIFGGQGSFSSEESMAGRSGERHFRVERFGVAKDQAMVQVAVSGEEMPASLLSPIVSSLDINLTPRLIDTDGNSYEWLGWVYEDNEQIHIRFTPSKVVESFSELPKTLSRARSDQTLRLLFLVSKGAEISHYVFGEDKAILTFDPPFEAEER